MTENKLGLNWSAVEKALAEGTFSGYKIGILETEKLLAKLLNDRHIPGRAIDQQIKYLRHFLSLPDKLEFSRHTFGRILNEPHFEITREETKQIVSGYWQAMLDIDEAMSTLSFGEKISLRAKYLFRLAWHNFRWVSLSVLSLAALIWFLAETLFGRKIITLLIIVNHFFVFKILFWTAIGLVTLLCLGGIIYFLTRRKRRF
ncbi:MAG: hypothetical protein AAB724_00610 [Patescibacteria group bacterium]